MLRMNEAYTPTLLMTHSFSLSSAKPLHPTERASSRVYQSSKEQCSTRPYNEVAETPAPMAAHIFLSQNLYHSLFWRIRLRESGGGLFTSVQNIMAVAADNAYLSDSGLALFRIADMCLGVWRNYKVCPCVLLTK